MPRDDHFELARSNIIDALERGAGTISVERWAGILMLASSEDDERRFEDVARTWRLERGLAEEDFIGPGVAR